MARNEHDGRSLEERLASLDAMSGESTGQPAEQQGPAEQENAPPGEAAQHEPQGGPPVPGRPVPQPPTEQTDPNANPWLAAPPPTFQQPPESFGPPLPPPYEGDPMQQPYEAGMLPPPYSAPGGYQGYDPSQAQAPVPAPAPAPAPAPQGGQPQEPPYQPDPSQQPSFDANGNAAPPFEQLPPYPSEQFPQRDAEGTGQPYQPIDPTTGQPYPQDTDATGQPYVPVDPQTGQPLAFDPGAPAQQQFPPMLDPNALQPYQPYDPNTGQPYAQYDPNAAAQAYTQVDPGTGQPYTQVDPATGQPYQPVDPNTGQPYQPVDPNTGQPLQGYGYPAGPQQDQGGYPQGPNPMMQPGQGYPGQPSQQQPPGQPENADSLSSENLLGERRIAPSSGWRRAVYKATAGNIHPGESQGDVRRKDLTARARTTVAGGHHRVAVMSLKGGVGKTTTTTGLGSMLGSLRGDTVIAVDANPDRGTLSDKVRLETAATVRDLLNNRDQIHRYADVRAFTSQNAARLEVLASDRDPAVSEAFSAEDYAAVAVVLEQYYSICITDCGTGLLHSAMAGVLSLADQLVLVSSPSVDGARSASATLDWLEAHDHGHLVRNGVVVLSMVRNRTRSQVDLDKLQAHFESRCRAVVRIPYDDHLEEGAEVELEQLAPTTREAYLNLAAVVGDGFAYQRPAQS
ncbi:MAG: AAA family ATPase [Spirillospora sp.]